MVRLAILLMAPAILVPPASAQQNSAANGAPVTPTPGVLLAKITAKADPSQSYALYIPSSYSADKAWPIVYAFDPAARGLLPVELMKEAAERYGYIIVGSNNSRNGSWTLELAAADAVLKDTRSRFFVDDRRIYFAGLSGGARLAAQIAQNCGCAAGVLLNGAGFSPKLPVSPERSFAVFAATGTYDFNYPEIIRMDEQLRKLAQPHFLRRFRGPHEWAPAELMNEALAWFRLQAMKSGRERPDNTFIQEQFRREILHAQEFEQSGDRYAAWNEYRQALATFDGLTDVRALRAGLQSLANDKSIRDAEKREHQDFDDQAGLESDISAGLASLAAGGQLADMRSVLEQQILNLRSRTEGEKQEVKRRVLKRALSGIFVQAMEAGNERLAARQLDLARAYFEAACAADPTALWALQNLAVARALTKDRKGTLEILRRAKSNTKDPAAFLDWLKSNSAFDQLRDTSEFRALLDSSTSR
jgi:dienelactone hydrolase